MHRTGNWCLRLLCAVLCVALLPWVCATATEQEQPQCIDTAVVHYSARTTSAVIGQVADGTVLQVKETGSRFYKIDCYGMYGYIAAEQVAQNAVGEYYVNCQEGSGETGTMPGVELAQLLQQRTEILTLTQQQLGVPYVYGGLTPSGFDCSGLVNYVYAQNGYALNRCADDQMQNGIIVAKEDLQAGDLVFFRDPGSPWLATHVGIYAGDHLFLHAKDGGVRYSQLETDWYLNYYVGARRIVNMEPSIGAAVENAANYTVGSGMRTAG